jgi:cellobiose phosphorylase
LLLDSKSKLQNLLSKVIRSVRQAMNRKRRMNVLGVVAEEQFVSYALTCIFKHFFWQEQVTFL